MDMYHLSLVILLALGLTGIVAFEVLWLLGRKRRWPFAEKWCRVLAVSGIIAVQLVTGWLAFTNGHYRGSSGQSLGEAVLDQFIPFRQPEALYEPELIAVYLLLLAWNVQLVIFLVRSGPRTHLS